MFGKTLLTLAVLAGAGLVSINACAPCQNGDTAASREFSPEAGLISPAHRRPAYRHTRAFESAPALQARTSQYSAPAVQAAPGNLWDSDLVAPERFQLNIVPTAEEKRIARQFARSYLKNLSEGSVYIHHLLSELKERNLPVELAAIPLIESGLNPHVISPAGARGIWQYMRVTGKSLGLKRTGSYDEINDFLRSTDVSLKYFRHLSEVFDGDWDLAAAAYNQGEFGVLRAVKNARARGQKPQYDRIGISGYAKAYVKRFHAYAELLRHPEAYGITPPHIKNRPAFRRVEIAGRVGSMRKASEMSGVALAELKRLNAGYLSDDLRAPAGNHGLLVPVERAARLEQALRGSPDHTDSAANLGR